MAGGRALAGNAEILATIGPRSQRLGCTLQRSEPIYLRGFSVFVTSQSVGAVAEEEWIPRREAARILSMSIAGVCELDGKELHPKRDTVGIRYALSEVLDALKRPRRRNRKLRSGIIPDANPQGMPGWRDELSSKVFAYFDQGKGIRECVVDLRVAPETVRALWAEYNRSLQEGPPPAPMTPRQELELRRVQLDEAKLLERAKEKTRQASAARLRMLTGATGIGKGSRRKKGKARP